MDCCDEDDSSHDREHRCPHVVAHRPSSNLVTENASTFEVEVVSFGQNSLAGCSRKNGKNYGKLYLSHLPGEWHVKAADSGDKTRNNQRQNQSFQHP